MKYLIKIMLLASLSVYITFADTNESQIPKQKNFYEIQSEMEKYWDGVPIEERNGWKQYKRWENFWEERTYPTGEFYNGIDIYEEMKVREKFNKDDNSTLDKKWSLIGPINVPSESGGNQGIGRINCVRLNPQDKKNREIWIGSSTGGVWKSDDRGNSWRNFDFSEFLSLGVNDIAISPTNPDIVYVATGDAFGLAHSAMQNYSIGVIKTTDGGESWDVTNFAYEYDSQQLIGRLLVNPDNPDIVIAATSTGIFRTEDGGLNWELTNSSSFFIDMEYHPLDHNIMYASTFSWQGNGQIHKSEDNGKTWRLVESYGDAVRIALAVSPDQPDYVYALTARRMYNSFHSVRVSIDQGEEWVVISDYNQNPNYLGRLWGTGNDANVGQGAYDLCLAVNPNDASEVFLGGINIWKSTSSGQSFEINTHWYGANDLPFVHADIHDLVYSDDGSILFSTHDGGIDYTTNGGQKWKSISNGLSITQYYRMGQSIQDPNLMIGGSQDNGSHITHDGGKTWNEILGGDGMECVVNPKNDKYVYASMYYGRVMVSSNRGLPNTYSQSIADYITGENADWTAPLELDPSVPSRVYVGHQNIYRSNTNGTYGSYTKITDWDNGPTLQNLAIAPSNPSVIYASTTSRLYASYDNGNDWQTIMSSKTAITDIEVDPNDANRIWVTKSGFSENDKVWEYNGEEWKNITGNLPNVPMNVVKYQQNSPDRLYLGSDVGPYYTDYNSAYWERYGSDIPNVIIMDLEINHDSNLLRAASYGRGIWEAPIDDCNISQPKVKIIGETQFCQGDSVIIQVVGDYPQVEWSNGETSHEIVVKETGVYSVSIEDPNGCVARSEAVYVEAFDTNEMIITTPSDKMLCLDGTLSLRASFGFDSYEWSNGETDRIISVSEPGKYWVKGVSSNGCEVTSEIFEVVYSIPEKPSISQWGNKLYAPEAERHQWYYEGERIFGAVDSYYEMKEDESGVYQVEVFDLSDCSAVSDEYNAVVGVKELDKGEFVNVHPNPGNGEFNVDMRILRGSYVDLKISDINGNKIKEIKNISNENVIREFINIKDEPAGVYFLTISNNNMKYLKKIIKQ